MLYHQADPRWEIFGMNDFESYCEKSVVPGLFHSLVSKHVKDAYLVAEYMMAHAYYHYPLYDEAFSKLLLIVEMAVKIRCKELGIVVETNKVSKKTGQPINKVLEVLISEMEVVEPSKNIYKGLHWLREQRNSKMHPHSHGYMGAMYYHAMKIGVTLLNKIFISCDTLQLIQKQTSFQQNLLGKINQRPFVFEGRGYLVEEIEVREVLSIGDRQITLVIIHPITDKITEQVERHNYKEPETFIVDEIQVTDAQVTMRVVDSKNLIKFSITTHPENKATYDRFISERNAAKAKFKGFIFNPIELPTGAHNDFLHHWYHKL